MTTLEKLLKDPLKDDDIHKKIPLQTMLQNLQGNILRSHGRRFAYHIFLQFKRDEDTKAGVNDWIRTKLADDHHKWHVTSAQQQRDEAQARRKLESAQKQLDGTPADSGLRQLFVSCLFSANGYEFLLGRSALEKFDAEFIGGMKRARHRLQDPDHTLWEHNYQKEIDAVILLAASNKDYLDQETRNLIRDIEPFTAHCWAEYGYIKRNEAKHSIEHFGYVDSRSQPLFFQSDLDKESKKDGITLWNPGAGPRLVITRDPLGGEMDYGSYLVFRKLRQDVDGFENQIKTLAAALNVKEETARALVMGRSRNGTPIVLDNSPQDQPDAKRLIPNNFRYDTDFTGQQCPFHAHIRRMNPRWAPGDQQYDRRIARRGMLYGRRRDHQSVGLLFMCYQSNLKTQFEALQGEWAHAPQAFPPTGYDAMIGRMEIGNTAAPIPPQQWPVAGTAATRGISIGGFVALQGGEYFFAPSIQVLRNLGKS